MTYDQPDCTLPEAMLEQIAEQGFAFIPELLRIVLNAAMRSEHEHHLGAARYERSAERRGYATGYKPKTVTTRARNVTFDVPQVRDGEWVVGAICWLDERKKAGLFEPIGTRPDYRRRSLARALMIAGLWELR